MNNDINLGVLAQQWIAAKEAEDAAIKHRRDIGKLIESALPGDAEGTTSEKLDGLRISVTRKVTRKVDTDRLQANWEFIPSNVRATFKWSADVNIKHLRAMQELGAADLATANGYITTKPAASSVAVELIEDK